MLASASGSNEQLREGAERFADATDRYARDIEQEGPLLGHRGLEIRRVMERTLLQPSIVEGAFQLPQAEKLCKSLSHLYSVLLPKLIVMRHAGDAEAAIANEELAAHYQHLLRVTCTATPAARPAITQLLVDHYGQQSIVPMYRVFVEISELLKYEQELTSQIAIRNFDLITESFGERFDQFLQIGGPDQAKLFLALHRHLSRAITHVRDRGEISEPEYQRLDREIGTRCVEPVAQHLFTVWLVADQQNRSYFAGRCWSLLNDCPLSNESARERADNTTQSVIDLLSAWRGDRNSLGTVYFDRLDWYRREYGAGKEIGYASIGMLPLVAPEPSRKTYIVDALREALVDDREQELLGQSADRPSQVGRVLALCLLSDHLFFATKANTSHDAVAATSLISCLKDNQAVLGSYEGALTPAQILYVELLRLSRGGESAERIAWVRPYNARSRERISERAQRALTWLMYEIYRCKSLDGSAGAPVSTTTAVLSVPWEWGAAVARLPEEGRVAEWRESEREFFNLADLVLEEVARKQPAGSSEFDISVQISTMLDIVRTRGSYQDRRFPDRQCSAVKAVRDVYCEPGSIGSASSTYFTTLRQTLVDLQGVALSKSDRRASQGAIEKRAQSYVETLQRLCIAEFLQQEIYRSGAAESAQGGSISRELREVCEQFGFIERDPRIAEILSEKTVSSIFVRVHEYTEQLTAELSSLVHEMQIVKP
jgi:hypothetical protein